MQAGVKERARYKDITWLMPSVDLPSIFLKLGVIAEPQHGHEIRAFCPDHHLFTGRKQSEPNWTINTVTGETFCFTEARGSSILWTVCRLLKCEPDDAAMFLAGKSTRADMMELELAAFKVKTAKLREQTKPSVVDIKGLDAIAKDIQNRKMSERAYQFFIHPPGKKYPTNISRETVDRYRVFERTRGYYSDRVIIPYFINGEIVGFCAIDLLGKEAWMKAHPAQSEKDYKKVRYPDNFKSTECLFGFDDCPKEAEFIIVTEGAREVMKLTQEGFPAVAILGAYISQGHRILLSKLGPKRIILMFDGDDAGSAITTRAAKALEVTFQGNRIQKCFLPRGRDPKTLDRNELQSLIEKTKIT
jgi:5S rRNA maturation endonuclease (ribonuclease M5)